MNSNKLRIYPSGFFGSSTVTAYKVTQETINKQFMMISTTETFNKKDITGSAEVVNLINLSQADSKNDFDLNQQIIECALEAFGTFDLSEWIKINYNSGLSYNHKLFIEETLAYIFNGTKRTVSTISWGTLLVYNGNETGQDKKMLEFTNACVNNADTMTLDLKRVIWKWCARNGGIDDMLSSLNVLFGNH